MLAASVDASTGNRVEMWRFIRQDFFLVSDDSNYRDGTGDSTKYMAGIRQYSDYFRSSLFYPGIFKDLQSRPPSRVLVSSL